MGIKNIIIICVIFLFSINCIGLENSYLERTKKIVQNLNLFSKNEIIIIKYTCNDSNDKNMYVNVLLNKKKILEFCYFLPNDKLRWITTEDDYKKNLDYSNIIDQNVDKFKEKAEKYIKIISSDINFADYELKYSKSMDKHSDYCESVCTFLKKINNFLVIGGGMSIYFRPDGKFSAYFSSKYHLQDVPTNVKITRKEAEKIALKYLKEYQRKTYNWDRKLVINPKNKMVFMNEINYEGLDKTKPLILKTNSNYPKPFIQILKSFFKTASQYRLVWMISVSEDYKYKGLDKYVMIFGKRYYNSDIPYGKLPRDYLIWIDAETGEIDGGHIFPDEME